MLKVNVVGGSGYAGGELLRLILGHPGVELQQVTSQRYAGRYIHTLHPNLRGQAFYKFTTIDQLKPCDVLFLALPHKEASGQIEHFSTLANKIVDLSADFRIKSPSLYAQWYKEEHPAPDWLEKFVYGLPELHREDLKEANYASGVGCNATAVNLALAPLAEKNLLEKVIVEVKVGSSEGGNQHSLASHHPERSGSVRSFAPIGHRHQAEMEQELGDIDLYFSATAIEMVRGILCTAHCFLKEKLSEKEIWKIYRQRYGKEPFVRLVKDSSGIYRYPEPKILAGSNFCDIGFALDEEKGRLVVISAIDNLMKGAAGTALQAMNLMTGQEEKAGLEFPGLHPV